MADIGTWATPVNGPTPGSESGQVGRAIMRSIRAYQRVSATRPPRCRYLPTCSQYAVEAIGEYGAIRGSWLGVKRVFRCHPFGSHGHDPVPRKG